MAALLAYVCTLVVIPLFLAMDRLAGGYLIDMLYSPVPIIRNISWVPATIFYLVVIYAGAWAAFTVLLRGVRELDDLDASPRRASGLVRLDRTIRWDYGQWPVYLSLIVIIVSLVTLPAMVTHLVSPVVWTLVALLAPTIISVRREREPAPIMSTSRPVAQKVAKPDSLPLNEVTQHLRNHKRYRGQLRAAMHLPARASLTYADAYAHILERHFQDGTLMRAVLASLGITGTEQLYPHQRDALAQLLDDDEGSPTSHLILATGPGSGRHMTLFLATLERALRRGSNVLVVTPNEQILKREYERFRELADQTDWHYALHEMRLDASYRRGIPDPPPEIVFCSLDTLHGVMLKDTRPWGEFFAGLDLVITYDIDHYTSIVGANAAQVFRRLRLVTAAAGGKLQFTATARPAANLEAFATALFGIDPSVDHVHRYAVDGSARPEQTFGVWLPPLDRYGEAGVGGHAVARVRRQSALAAAVELASVLVSLTDDYRLLVHCYDRGRVDAEWLSNEIDRAVGMSLPEQRLRVTTEEAELSGRQAHYDGLIILGTPEHVSEIERLCGQLGGERRGGLALVLGTHSPAALHMIRSFHTSGSIDFLDTRARTQLTINTRHADVVAKHLACAVHETRMRRSQIVETFGLPGVQAADALVANGFAAWQDVVADRSVFGYQDSVLILGQTDPDVIYEHCRLDTIGADGLIPVRSDNGGFPVRWIDSNRETTELFEHRVIQTGAQPLVLVRSRTSNDLVAQIPNSRLPVDVLPHYRYQMRLAPDEQPADMLPSRIGNGDAFVIQRKSIVVWQELLGTRQPDEIATHFYPDARGKASSIVADAIVFTADRAGMSLDLRVAHTLAHALAVALRAVLPATMQPTDVRVLAVPAVDGLTEAPAVLLFDTVDGGAGLADGLLSIMHDLLRDTYRVLVTCPCQVGCPACTNIGICAQCDDGGSCVPLLDKRGALIYLGRLLGDTGRSVAGRTPEQLDSMRYVAVTDPNDLVAVREQVFQLGLSPLLNLTDERADIAPIRFVTQAEAEQVDAELDGFYNILTREVAVRPNVEEHLVGVIAHEYAHDWLLRTNEQGVPNVHPSLLDSAVVPYKGHLFVEGFAQWAELRVLDAYGFKQDVDEIGFRFYDEYGEGFQIIKAVEDQQGIDGILRLMRSPMTRDTLNALMAASNTRDRVIAKWRLLEGGEIQLPPSDVISDPGVGTGTDAYRILSNAETEHAPTDKNDNDNDTELVDAGQPEAADVL
ncbi:MAG TPA: hypothetical protein DEU95_14975 [Chloroflexi bacterium]|nr:hypothetical protein [Chloroflexota bacterium]HCG30963.1 hypothetical protein [Chloroflexota bacterium]